MRAVCFDLMDTVLADPYREALEAATGLALDELKRLVDPGCWPAFELAEIDEAEFVRRFFADPTAAAAAGGGFDLDAFHAARRAGYRWLPGMRELVEALDGRVERYVASNYPVWIEELRLAFALDEAFDGVYASHHLRARKPDRAFFERLLARIGHAPADCLFVDDRAGNCAAAEAVGMRAHLFTSAEDLAHRLALEGVAA